MSRLISDTAVVAERNLTRIKRAPDLLTAFTIQPVMFLLLFVYVFGGAIQTPGYDYKDFLLPGIMVQNIAFGGFVTALGLNEDLNKGLIDRFRSLPMSRAAVLAGRTLSDVFTNFLSILVQNIAFGGFVTALGLNEDLHKGLIDRFRSLPMARPAVLAGRTLSDVVTNLLSVVVLLTTGLIIGFSFHASAFEIAGGLGLLLLFGYAFSWVFALLGMLVSSPESANSLGFIAVFPLTFISSAFVPVDSMPSALRWFADINPFTIVVNAMRALWVGAPAGNSVWGAVVWSLVILGIFAPLAVWRYRRAAGR